MENQNHSNPPKHFITRIWETIEAGKSPEKNLDDRLREAGYVVAQGDAVPFVVVDKRTNTVSNLKNYLPENTSQEVIQDKLGKTRKSLPSVPEVMGVEGEEAEQMRAATREKFERLKAQHQQAEQKQSKETKRNERQAQVDAQTKRIQMSKVGQEKGMEH